MHIHVVADEIQRNAIFQTLRQHIPAYIGHDLSRYTVCVLEASYIGTVRDVRRHCLLPDETEDDMAASFQVLRYDADGNELLHDDAALLDALRLLASLQGRWLLFLVCLTRSITYTAHLKTMSIVLKLYKTYLLYFRQYLPFPDWSLPRYIQ